VTPALRNMGHRRRLAVTFAAVALLGAGLVAVSRVLPRLMARTREIERLKAQNDERRRKLEGMRRPAPPHHSLSEEEVRRRLKIIEPGDTVLLPPAPTERPQQVNSK